MIKSEYLLDIQAKFIKNFQKTILIGALVGLAVGLAILSIKYFSKKIKTIRTGF